MTPAAKNTLIGVALLGGSYGAYRYIYVPWKIKQELLRQAAVLAQQRGISQGDALALLGSVGCQGVAMYYGVPPQASGGICNNLGRLASQLVQQAPAIGAGLGTGFNSLASGVAAGSLTLTRAPITITKEVVSSAYGGGKTVVGDVYGGVKTVVHDLNPLNWF